MFPRIIPNGSRLWSLEAFSRRLSETHRQMAYKGKGGPVEPVTVKVEGSGCFWLRASSHEIAVDPQAELKRLSD